MSLLYDKVVNLINKPAGERHDNEITQILPWFTKKSDLFKALHTDIVRDIVKNCRFEQTKRDIVIIRQMDKGDCFYIILSGSVSIHINTTLTEEEYEQVKETQIAEEESWAKDTTGRPLDRSKYGIYVGKIDAGKSFGELALINADCVRNATIIADEETDLLCVDRNLYNRSLKAFQANEFEERKEFVRTSPMFHNWAPRYKKMMAYSLKKQVLHFEDTIIKQGGPVDGIHFIIKGQVKIRVDPSQHSNQYTTLYPLGDIEVLEKEKARELLRKEMNLAQNRRSDRKYTYQRRHVPQSEVKKANLKPLELCLAGAVDVIGDIEVAMGLNSYSQTVECTEESIIFQLDQRNYDRLIEKRNPGALEMLRDIVHTKLTLHFSRLQDECIPLYRFFLYTLDEKEKDARRKARMPRSRSAQELEVTVENLQKGPLVNMYGPGSVFYLIRKRAKEMRLRQKRRQNKPGGGGAFRIGFTPKTTQAASRGAVGNQVFMFNPDDPDPGSATASMINFYGANQDAHLLHDIDDPEFMDDSRRDYLDGELDYEERRDWATSDSALCELEQRLSQWHSSLPTVQKGTCVVPLHRYQVEEENKPKPGNKVYVKVRTKQRNVSFFSFQNNGDSTSSPEGAVGKTSAQTSRSPLSSSMPLLESIIDKPSDVMSEIAERPKTSTESQRPRSSMSEPTGHPGHKKKRKQYTAAEYQELKAELRRRQKAWIPHMPYRSASVL